MKIITKKMGIIFFIVFLVNAYSVSAWSWCWIRDTGLLSCGGDLRQQNCCSGNLRVWPEAAMEYRISYSTSESLLSDIREGMSKWNNIEMSTFTFTEGSRTNVWDVKLDYINVVNIDSSFCDNFPQICDQGILGLSYTFTANEGTSNYRALDSNIILNGDEWAWGDGTGTTHNTVAVVAHEAGHNAGLTHPGSTCVRGGSSGCGPNFYAATMFRSYPGGQPTDKSSLELDDVASLIYGYPRSTLRVQVFDEGNIPVAGANVELIGTSAPVNGTSISEGGSVYGDIASSLIGDEASSPTYIDTSPFNDTDDNGYTNYINPIHQSFSIRATKGNQTGTQVVSAPPGVSTVIVMFESIDTSSPDTAITSGPSGSITYNDVTFTFTGSDDVTPTFDLMYSFKLEGYDTNWSSYTSSTSRSYKNLPNGSYTFQVRARDQIGKVDPSPAFISFAVNYIYSVLHVDVDVPSSGNGTTWNEAFKSISEAIDASSKGDEIWVRIGTYALSSTINLDKGVSIYGGFDGTEIERNQRNWQANVTTVDGQDQATCFLVTADATIDGFTITRGYAEFGYTEYRNGGGLYVKESFPTIANCNISGNTTRGVGGGIYIENSFPTVTNCTFTGNSARYGGGIHSQGSSPIITNCTINDNTASSHGGGIRFSSSSPTITNCTISGNMAYSNGGIDIQNSSAIIADCTISNNTSTSFGGAGGIRIASSSATINSCIISGNLAYTSGGGIVSTHSTSIITNCIISSNTAYGGGGIYNWESETTFTNCTFSRNDGGKSHGGAIYNYSTLPLTVTNSILWGNVPDTVYTVSEYIIIKYSDIQTAYAGEGNIVDDPLFVDPQNGNYHLRSGSPCINVGTSIGAPKTDIDGDSRPQGAGYDMGAYEYRIKSMPWIPLLLFDD